MEYYFRKYAFKTDCGLIRLWIGPFPIVFLTRPPSVKVSRFLSVFLYKYLLCKIASFFLFYLNNNTEGSKFQTILENPNLNEKPSEYKVLNGMWGDGLIAR